MVYLREEERRRLTTDAAIRLICRDGIDAASLRRIAAEAGVPLSSLHHVYRDKDSLLNDAFQRSAEEVKGLVDKVEVDEPGDLEAAIGALIMTFVASASALWPAQRSQYELFLWALRSPARTPDALRDIDYFVDAFADFLAPYAQGRGVDLQFLAEIVSAQIDGATLQTFAGKSPDDLAQRQRQLAAGLIAAASLE